MSPENVAGSRQWRAPPLSTLLTHRAANVGGSVAGSHLLYCRDSRRAVPAWSSEAHVGLGLSCCNGLHIGDMADALGDTLPEQQLGAHLQVLWVFQEAETYHCLLPCPQLVLQQIHGHWPWTMPLVSEVSSSSPLLTFYFLKILNIPNTPGYFLTFSGLLEPLSLDSELSIWDHFSDFLQMRFFFPLMPVVGVSSDLLEQWS